jgi:glycosyltransferase involved in cell wall biosynthesis
MSNEKTFIILSPGFPKDDADTTCLPFLQNFIRELNDQFPLLHVVVLAFDYPFTTTTYQWNNNEVTSFNGWKKKNFRKIFKWFRIWMALKQIRRNNNVMGMLSLWCGECAYLGTRFAKRNDIAHYCWIQGQDAKKENRYVSRTRPAATELVAISDFIQAEFENNHGIWPSQVIPIGIRPAEFLQENVRRDIDVIGVGSLISLKQYGLFIEVIKNISEDFPDIKVIICGKGPEEKKLNELVEKYGLEKNITLTGELPHDEILKRMNHSRIFLHTSNYEGLGVVCIEALYAGCHVISFVQPIHHAVEQWHIVRTKEEMIGKLKAILKNFSILHTSVLTFTMKESVKKFMQLYNYNESSNC